MTKVWIIKCQEGYLYFSPSKWTWVWSKRQKNAQRFSDSQLARRYIREFGGRLVRLVPPRVRVIKCQAVYLRVQPGCTSLVKTQKTATRFKGLRKARQAVKTFGGGRMVRLKRRSV